MSSPPSSAVLVLDGDSRAGLATVQSLGRRGVSLHVGVRAAGSLTAHSRWCAQIHQQPAAEAIADAHAWMRGLHAQNHFSLVVPTTEAALLWLRALSPEDPLRRLAQLPSDEALDIALSKERTRALAERIGLPVPGSRLLQRGTLPDDHPPAEFPCVLKPAASKVLVNGQLQNLAPAVVRDASLRTALLKKWLPHTDVQEQQWVPGRGVGVELVYVDGKAIAEFVHERVHELPLTGGGSTLRRAAKPDRHLLELSKWLLDALQWQGVAMVEWRRADDGTVHLMEINPRLWGSLPLTIAAGVDVPVFFFFPALLGSRRERLAGATGRSRAATPRGPRFGAFCSRNRCRPCLPVGCVFSLVAKSGTVGIPATPRSPSPS